MADAVRITNLPDSGSPERVAYDLWLALRHNFNDRSTPQDTVRIQLALYSQCLNAVSHGDVDVSEIK